MTTPDPRDRNLDGRVSAGEAARSALYRHVPHPHIAARREQGPVKVADQHPDGSAIARFNGRVARLITRGVGTMYCFYLFNLLASASAKAAFASHDPTVIVNWVSSNWIQLVLLPAILVGQNLQGAAADGRAEQTYHDASATLHESLQIQEHLAAQDAALQAQDKVLAELITHVKGAAASATEGTTP